MERDNPFTPLFVRIIKNRQVATERKLFSYMHLLLEQTPVYVRLHRLWICLRRAKLALWILRIFSWILIALETGTLVLAALVLLLPLLALFLALIPGMLVAVGMDLIRMKHIMNRVSRKSTLYLLFIPPATTPFFCGNARELSHRGTVILLSPYWLSGKGMKDNRFYVVMRREHSAYLIRRYALRYFLKACTADRRLVMIY